MPPRSGRTETKKKAGLRKGVSAKAVAEPAAKAVAKPAAKAVAKPAAKNRKAEVLARHKPSPIRAFKSQAAFEQWLERNQQLEGGVWIRFARKGSGVKSITHPEALDTALCFGWIDALRLPESDTTYLHRFLPRRAKSLWSQINREKALALIEAGRMRPGGQSEIDRAKQDGRWDAAYVSPANATMPPEFERELARHPKAQAFFETLNRVNRYAIIWRLATAKKQETKERLSRKFIAMLEKGETLH